MPTIKKNVVAVIARSDVNPNSCFGGGSIPLQRGRAGSVHVHLSHASSVLRIGMGKILSAESGLEVIEGVFPTSRVDMNCVVVTDYTAAMLLARQPASTSNGLPKVLIVTNRNKEWEVRRAVESGVRGYLLETCMPEELVRSVRLLGAGVGYLSPSVARSVRHSRERTALTRREQDVLQLLALGSSDKLIASQLGIGLVTVKTHVVHLLQKLDATARTHAVVIAFERGLLYGPDHLVDTAQA